MLDKNSKSVSSKNTKPAKRKKQKQTSVVQTGTGKTYPTTKMLGKKGKAHTFSTKGLITPKTKIIDNISKEIKKAAKKAIKIKNEYSINTTKITSFLKTINKTELGYINHIVNIACSMNQVIRKYNVTKERFCADMGIKTSQYNDYIRGSRNYDLKDMAKFNSLHEALVIENAKKQDPIKFPK